MKMSLKHIIYAAYLALVASAVVYAAEETKLTPEEEMALAEKSFNEEDIKLAAARLRSAAQHNYLPAQVKLGEFMFGSDDYEESFGWYLTAAIQGDADGQYNVAQMYANGFGIEKSTEKAAYWLKKAAEQDNFLAVQLLATLYKGKRDKETNDIVEIGNNFGIKPNQEQADTFAAKLPNLEKLDTKRRKFKADELKKIAVDAQAKLEQAGTK